MKQFLWTPGDGIDPVALARLRSHFPMPAESMGEAWFMGDDRRMFHELQGNPDDITVWRLQQALSEIASGTGSFGPLPEWKVWYHYLLGAVLPRSHETVIAYLLESLLTGFMAIYPNGIQREPYAGFRDDVLSTLGRCLMDGAGWNGSEIVIGKVLHAWHDTPDRPPLWQHASGDFAASMFFCLKYLPEPLIEPWLRSVFDIPSPHWRAQVIAWFVGAHDLLDDVLRWPSEFRMKTRPSVDWDWSHCLKAELAVNDDGGAPPVAAFIPEASRIAALNAVRSYFSEDRFLEWLEAISTVPYLEAELAEVPSTFETLYVR